jgi:aminoglycoside phosphotransferase (APT) family kinase protein
VSLLENVAQRTPLAAPDGKSGNLFESVVLKDGSRFVVKRMAPGGDWLGRATGDTGRAWTLWSEKIFERIPSPIDHAVVTMEPDGDGWVIVMRDVSDELVAEDVVLSRSESRCILEAANALHDVFWGERVDGLCSLGQRYAAFSPATAERERAGPDVVPKVIGRGWEIFADVVPEDVSGPIFAVLERPGLLARELARSETTLIHGDLKLGNIGLTDDRVVLLDWTDRVGFAPPASEFGWYLAINASRLDCSREQAIADFLDISGERRDERALELAVIGGFAQLGWNKAHDAVEEPDVEARQWEAADLEWWISRVRRALDEWSPI